MFKDTDRIKYHFRNVRTTLTRHAYTMLMKRPHSFAGGETGWRATRTLAYDTH